MNQRMNLQWKTVYWTGLLGLAIFASPRQSLAQTSATDQDIQEGDVDQQTRITAPASSRSNMEATAMIADWPTMPRAIAQLMIQKYGQPNTATAGMLAWNNNGPWKRTIVYREELQHNFPRKHTDFLQQFISYHVPAGKYNDLAEFDGSVIVDRTKGEISARCDKEESNILALNLANEIATGKRTASDARNFLAKTVEQSESGKSSLYTERLMFQPIQDSADPDHAVLSR